MSFRGLCLEEFQQRKTDCKDEDELLLLASRSARNRLNRASALSISAFAPAKFFFSSSTTSLAALRTCPSASLLLPCHPSAGRVNQTFQSTSRIPVAVDCTRRLEDSAPHLRRFRLALRQRKLLFVHPPQLHDLLAEALLQLRQAGLVAPGRDLCFFLQPEDLGLPRLENTAKTVPESQSEKRIRRTRAPLLELPLVEPSLPPAHDTNPPEQQGSSSVAWYPRSIEGSC